MAAMPGEATAFPNFRLSLTVAVTVRDLTRFPILLNSWFKHLKAMQRTCKEVMQVSTLPQGCQFRISRNFQLKVELEVRQKSENFARLPEKGTLDSVLVSLNGTLVVGGSAASRRISIA
jgi:hypothetical protein